MDRPHQGVGPETADENDRRVHAYYQWVPFVLFFQACLFHAPHLLFKLAEEGKVER